MDGLSFDIAHLLAGGLVLVSFMLLYQDRLYALLNIFAVQAANWPPGPHSDLTYDLKPDLAYARPRSADRAVAGPSARDRCRPAPDWSWRSECSSLWTATG